MAYGHAFVILAAAWAHRAVGIDGARRDARQMTWHFHGDRISTSPRICAYADERDSRALHNVCDGYRGQNANMHTVEALIAAYREPQAKRMLSSSAPTDVARKFTVDARRRRGRTGMGTLFCRLDSMTGTYNIDKPDDLFKPWGFQPGHQVEWAKLLLQTRHAQAPPTGTLQQQNGLYCSIRR